MSCCNHDCNQGRNCPARVARVGQRYQGPEPLLGSPWRRHLKELARAFLLLIAVMLATALAAALIA